MGFEVDCYEAALSVTLHLGAEAALSLAFPDPVESLFPAWYNDGKHSVSIGGTNGGSVLVQRDMLFYHHR